MALTSYQHTAHYTYIDQALRAQWTPFQALEAEMAGFVPKPVEEFRPRRDAEIERLRVLNPDKTLDDLSAFVDRQFKFATSPEWQFHEQFEQRHVTQFVTVIMLAHALSEALINAVLAITSQTRAQQNSFRCSRGVTSNKNGCTGQNRSHPILSSLWGQHCTKLLPCCPAKGMRSFT
jgi:hypothetical protein